MYSGSREGNTILNLWRQFGRRYFWCHLFIGIVATGFGLPAVLNSGDVTTAGAGTTQNRQNQALSAFDSLFLQSSQPARTSQNVNYWQQHAVRNVIRQISFAFSCPEDASKDNTPAEDRHDASAQNMLAALYAILTDSPALPVYHPAVLPQRIAADNPSPSFSVRWIARTGGIRAGPVQSA
ncbi:protein translocase subunit secM [Morganella morganii]|nr:protein translocase subunit secM [Morganella morganii]